ncbi:CoxG family protein [Limoniibacter endophyticus]|uniref:Carbon monoxide dehydrogenase n=1 Tax=Limoniibacter endophyticus TaxID=1565040 RepID=A0A8J3DLD4_9HYPH|nr:carbon monoxide dehydrogenase subunit G [Limoniibacter endophyticus]GHC80061.1 carbon monoxide dehydrogenase [Limoniibacter endophyticus]
MTTAIDGEQMIDASSQRVWEAMNDPKILMACVPGCHSFEKIGENLFEAAITIKFGPIKADFSGLITVSNINAPKSYTISGEAAGSIAGFASGSADVVLYDGETPDQTRLVYTASADLGGKIAQLGKWVVGSTSRKLAQKFFERFNDQIKLQNATSS